MTFYGKAISRSDTARQCVWEREKVGQSQAMFHCVCFTCSSKGDAFWLWFVVIDPYFFVAEKPLPMTWTCTVLNFCNLHGQFRSLGFEQTESSDWCWFVVKNSFFREVQRENWRFLIEGPAHCFILSCDCSLLRFVCYLLRFHLASDWLRNNKHFRNFLWCSLFYRKDCNQKYANWIN